MVATDMLDDSFSVKELSYLRKENGILKHRVVELEQINEDHRKLNGELRKEMSINEAEYLIDLSYGELRMLQKSIDSVDSFERACRNEALSIADILIKKQHDYGQENILVFGEEGIMIRLSDKIHRLINLFKNRNAKPQNESVQDTFIDIAGYAIIGLMLQKQTFQLPLQLDEESS